MITAVVLAGGESKRMGQPKLLLAWGSRTVLDHVIGSLKDGGVEDVLVVAGSGRAQVEAICGAQKVRSAYNPEFSTNEMLGSLQVGLRALSLETDAALVTLGDQPQIQAATVSSILDEWTRSRAALIVPSFGRHRGHPWLLRRDRWAEVLTMKAPESPREFLDKHAAEITYVEINSPSILQDIDTPEDYLKARP